MLPASITYKQLEAVFWIIELRSFHAAARKLHTTQSAISKRIRDLEGILDAQLFDRSGHAARPTPRGEEFWTLAKQLLEQRNSAFSRFGIGHSQPEKLKFGVSEFSAMTWLPAFIQQVQARYPGVPIQPDVDVAAPLLQKLVSGDLDIAVLAGLSIDQRFSKKMVGVIESTWVCVPDFPLANGPLTPAQLCTNTLLMQRPDGSISARLCTNWADIHGVRMDSVIHCNSLSALMGMTLSGIGIGYLPIGYARAFLQRGQLREVSVTTALPQNVICAAHLPHPRGHFVHELVEIATRCCRFDSTL